MSELTRYCKEVLAVRNCPAVHALLLDVWQVALERGEAEGLLWAQMVRKGVEEYERRRKELAAWGRATELAQGGTS